MAEDRVLAADIAAVRLLVVGDHLRTALCKAGLSEPEVLPAEACFPASDAFAAEPMS
jgi:hypothetical protein